MILQVYLGELYIVWTSGCDHHHCRGEKNILQCFIHSFLQENQTLKAK